MRKPANLLFVLCIVLGAVFHSGGPVDAAASLSYQETFQDFTYFGEGSGTVWDISAHQVELVRASGITRYDPAAVLLPSGQAYVAWRDFREGQDHIFLQKLDSSGNRLWAGDQRVNDPVSANFRYGISLTETADGELYVVFIDDRDGTRQLFAQKFNEMGSRLWPEDVQVNLNGGEVEHLPSATLASDGSLAAAWISANQVFLQMITPNGSRVWNDPVAVSPPAGAQNAIRHAAAASDGQGNITVAFSFDGWKNQRPVTRLYVQSVDSSGELRWSSPQDVSLTDHSDGFRNLKAAAGDSGVYLVWQDTNSQRAYEDDIFAQRVSSSGDPAWSAPLLLNSNQNDAQQGRPGVQTDAQGNLFAWWVDERNQRSDLFMQVVNPQGDKQFPQDRQVTSAGIAYPNTEFVDVTADLNPLGAAVLLFNLQDSLSAQVTDASGQPVANQLKPVNDLDGPTRQEKPAVAAAESGETLALWHENRLGHSFFIFQKFDAEGQRLLDANTLLDAGAGNGEAAWGSLAALGSETVAAWEFRQDGRRLIHVQKLDADGSPVWEQDIAASSNPGDNNQERPSVAVDADENIYITWTQFGQVMAQKLAPDGSRLWGDGIPAAVNQPGSNQIILRLDSSIDILSGSSEPVIAWAQIVEEYDGDLVYLTHEIRAQRLDTDGSPQWAEDVLVNASKVVTDLPAGDVRLQTDSQDNAVVAWFVPGWDDQDVFLQKISSNGEQLWDQDVTLKTNNGDRLPNMPALDVTGDGKLILTWRDTGSGSTGIYAQVIGPDGSFLLSEDIHVSAGQSAAGYAYPVVGVDASGNASLAWQETKADGDTDVFLIRLNLQGEPLWDEPRSAVEQDSSFLLAGYVQSSTVDQIDGVIQSATFDADYDLRGGSLRFHLSNNGGADWVEAAPDQNVHFTTTGSDLRWRAELEANSDGSASPVIHSIQIEYAIDMLSQASAFVFLPVVNR